MYLLELLIRQERAVFAGQLAEELDVTPQTVRNNMDELAEGGYIEKDKVSGRNLYRLTDAGWEYLGERLRMLIHDDGNSTQ